jgi:hypothetical protein
MFKNLRLSILVLTAAVSFVTFSFAVSAEEAAQTKKPAKTSPTPKKSAKATPTPNKKVTAKATPTPKKSAATTAKTKAADKKTNDKKSSTAKTTTKSSDAKNKKETAKTTKTTKDAKSSSAKNSTAKSKEKPVEKANAKTSSRPRETAKTTTAKASVKTSGTKSVVKTKPPVEETAADDDAAQIVVTDVSVPIRASAKSNASELSKVKLGTVLEVSQKSSSWYKVRYSNGTKTSTGWIPASAVGSLDDANKPQIYTQVSNRYYKPTMDFATASALYEFLTRSRSDYENSDAAADLQLKRLLALRSALKSIPVSSKDQSPYKEFLKAHEKEIVFSEPSGEFLTVSNLFWDLQKKYKSSPLAEQIAWEGAQNPLPGECEGYVNCHLFYARMTSGEYLSLYPNGKHSLEALTNLTNLLQPIVADIEAKKIYSGATDVTDRAEFNNLLAELRTIVSRLPQTEKEKTLQQLKKVAEGFR